MTTDSNRKLVGTEKVSVDVYEYEGVEWIEFRPYEEPYYYDHYSEYQEEGSPESCVWGRGNSSKIEDSYKSIDCAYGIINIDMSNITDIKQISGIIHFGKPKTLRVYQHMTEDGTKVFIKIYK